LISRQRYWGPPIPIIHCDACGPVAVPDDELPVLLPDVADVRPSGTSPLAGVASFVHTSCPGCGGAGRRETDVSDTFFDSSWYFLRHPSAERDDVAWDRARTTPVDLYAGGPEHVARHHLYARFVTMALHDLGLVGFDEPFPRLRLHGTITKDGAKMSKSRGNVVSPDDYVDRHGGDVLRVHLLSSGRWSGTADFRDAGIAGVERLFTRLWRLVHGEAAGPGAGGPALARTVVRVTAAIEDMRFNNAVAALGQVAKQASADEAPTVIRLLAPLAPYLAEELWATAGGDYSVHTQPWPAAAPDEAPNDPVVLVVQVDGRLRARLPVAAGLSAAEARRRAETAPEVARHLAGRRVERCVFVPDRLLNLVTFGPVEDIHYGEG
jgi:leucyl-tRNA synthetase